MRATYATPSASASAVSNDSASRCSISGFTAMRSITTSMSCFCAGFELRRIVELDDLAVDARAQEALRAQLLEQRRVLALARLHDGREQHDPRARGQRHHRVDHLRHVLRLERGPWSGQRGMPARA